MNYDSDDQLPPGLARDMVALFRKYHLSERDSSFVLWANLISLYVKWMQDGTMQKSDVVKDVDARVKNMHELINDLVFEK